MKFKMAAGTHVGLIRQNNEDNFVVSPDLSTSLWLIPQDGDYTDLGPYGALLVVADGMGGANAGEVASAICVDTIQQMFTPDALKNVVGNDKSIQQFMSEVVRSADLNILNRSSIDSSTQGMGTTVVMAWILGKRAYVCWCGDSRCYMLSKQRGLVRLSKDHSYVQELVDRGELEPELASEHPLSNVITRCLGDFENRAEPDTRIYELSDGDVIMLCSDGLCGLCNDNQIAEIISEFTRPDEYAIQLMECKNKLIDAALAMGGHDNVTVALCNIKIEGEPTPDDGLDTTALQQEETNEGTETDSQDAGTASADSETNLEEDNLEEDADGEDGDAEDSTEDGEKDELSKTVQNTQPLTHKKLWLVLSAVLLVIAALYIWKSPDCQNFRDMVSQYFSNDN